MTFSEVFLHFFIKYLSNRKIIIKFVIRGSELVEIDILLAQVQKFLLLAAVLIFFRKRHIGGSYQPISLILNSKQLKTTFYLLLNFKENRTKIATVRVPQRKNAKWPP